MMGSTVEPVEILTLVLAIILFGVAIVLCIRALETVTLVICKGRGLASLKLARNRVRNEFLSALAAFIIITAGYQQVTTPVPLAPSPYRLWFQCAWALLAGILLVKSVMNEIVVQDVMKQVSGEDTSDHAKAP